MVYFSILLLLYLTCSVDLELWVVYYNIYSVNGVVLAGSNRWLLWQVWDVFHHPNIEITWVFMHAVHSMTVWWHIVVVCIQWLHTGLKEVTACLWQSTVVLSLSPLYGHEATWSSLVKIQPIRMVGTLLHHILGHVIKMWCFPSIIWCF